MKRVKEDRLGIQRIAVDCVGRACLAIEILLHGKWEAQILCRCVLAHPFSSCSSRLP